MNEIKILHYGLSYNAGGIENIVKSWICEKPKNIIFDFLNDGDKPLAFEEDFIKKGSKIYKITHRYTNPFKRIKEINSILKHGNYKFVHFHIMNLDDPWPILLAIKNKTKIIVHCHSLYTKQDSIKEKLLKFETNIVLGKKEYIRLACSALSGRNIFGNHQFETLENGINLSSFQFSEENRKEIRNAHFIKDDEIIIGHVGRSCVEKNYPFILQSFYELIKSNKSIKLMFVGNMNEDKNILKWVENHNLDKNIVFVGKVQNVNDYYSAFDIFYMPSINEGIPLSVIEAQASGLPCVLSTGISKEADVSGNVKFVSLNINDVKNAILDCQKQTIKRNEVKIKKEYDITYSVNKLFNIYLNN